MKVPNSHVDGEIAQVSLSRLQNEGSQPSEVSSERVTKSIKATA